MIFVIGQGKVFFIFFFLFLLKQTLQIGVSQIDFNEMIAISSLMICIILFQIIIPIYFSEHRDYLFQREFACFIRALKKSQIIRVKIKFLAFYNKFWPLIFRSSWSSSDSRTQHGRNLDSWQFEEDHLHLHLWQPFGNFKVVQWR